MNICFVYKYYPCLDNLKNSGLGKYIYDIAQNLSRNHSISILTQTKTNIVFKQNKVKVYSLRRIIPPSLLDKRIILLVLYNLRIAWNLLRLNNKHHFDIIEFANWEPEGLVFTLIALFFHSPTKIVCRLHTGTYDVDACNGRIRFSTKVIHLIECLFLNLPNVHLSTSTRAHAQHCNNLYHLSNKKISIIPLGITLPKISSRNKVIHIKNKELRIVFIGRTEERKGILTLIKAIPYVLSREPRANFYIIGGQGNIDIFPIIHRIIPVQLLSRIHYQGYINSRKRINYFYKIADICVFPSLYESFGYTILEAMSYGKPVVATRVGGIPEIITHGTNGFLIPPKQHQRLATIICTLLSDVRLRNRLGKAARITVRDQFSINRLCLKTKKFYLE